MGPAAAELVACGRQLRKLSLFNNRLGDGGAARVAELAAAEALTALLELELSACSIGAPGMQSLFAAMQTGVAPALEVRVLASSPRQKAARLGAVLGYTLKLSGSCKQYGPGVWGLAAWGGGADPAGALLTGRGLALVVWLVVLASQVWDENPVLLGGSLPHAGVLQTSMALRLLVCVTACSEPCVQYATAPGGSAWPLLRRCRPLYAPCSCGLRM